MVVKGTGDEDLLGKKERVVSKTKPRFLEEGVGKIG